MPYSPKASVVPPLAMPRRFGWFCLRCFTLRGISMVSTLLARRGRGGVGGRRLGRGHLGRSGLRGGSVVAVAAATRPAALGTTTAAVTAATAAATALLLSTGLRGLLSGALGAGAAHVTLVDPHLHADAAEGGAGLVEAVV